MISDLYSPDLEPPGFLVDFRPDDGLSNPKYTFNK